jgi:PadR family transcriptional regulator, regulatory protein PadR
VPSRAYLGELEQIVLLALIRLGDNAYGVPIRQDIEKRTKRILSIGALYRTLERLEDKGFVSSRTGDPTPERGGRAKRFFRAETPGLRALRRTRHALDVMWEGLDLSRI